MSDFNRWTPPAQHAFCHHSTSLSRSLGHAYHFTSYNAATPPPPASTCAVACRRRQELPLDGARDLLSQIGQHITTVSFV